MFTLPSLSYDYAALSSAIDPETMQLHHTKHHQTYIDKLNAGLAEHPDLLALPVEQLVSQLNTLPESVRTLVRNHGGGHVNHSFFWSVLSPEATALSATLEKELVSTFGSVDSFKQQFEASATGLFGSGWAWLVLAGTNLEIMTTPNQESPLMVGKVPLWGVDVWEHAYYLRYQNRRPEYVSSLWNVMDGAAVSARYEAALG